MGNLLGAPITDKETHTGSIEPGGIAWGLSTMQGWRVHMEDAHIAESDLYALSTDRLPLPGHSVFAVFDGHGGTFAAFYAGNNFLRVLACQSKFVDYARFCHERATKEPTLDAAAKVEYLRHGLELLEQSLKDAFIELDKEVGMANSGKPHPDANKPYHPPKSNGKKTDDGQDGAGADTSADGDAQQAAKDHMKTADDGDSGTTACVVMITPDWIVCANAGDSRSVLSRNNHQATPLSYDHKPDDEEEERRIRAAGGYVTGGRVEGDLAVSRGFGDFRFKSMATVLAGKSTENGTAPNNGDAVMNNGSDSSNGNNDENGSDNGQDSSRPQMGPGDQKVSSVPDIIVQHRNNELDEFIVVACDGIWDVMSNQNCVASVSNMMTEGESNMGLIAEELLDECLELGSKDNMTAIVVKLPAQAIGDGEGVEGRRKAREQPNEEDQSSGAEDSPTEDTESSATETAAAGNKDGSDDDDDDSAGS